LVPGFKYVPYDDIAALEEAISDNTCAVMLEPIQGESGVRVPSQDYLLKVQELCKAKGALLILDEVQTGASRTGKPWGYEHFGVEPDIFTSAKGLGGGFPIGAMLAKEEVAQYFQPGDHASTFGGNPLACAAALATIETIINQDVLANVEKVGAYFEDKLKSLADKFQFITEVRGKGLMLGAQLDREGKDIVARCLAKGLLINCANGNVLRFVPPLNITELHVDEAVSILEEVLEMEEV
jgi:acetylornithine/N-succinyldiaminopimelate aminotransferase